MRPFILLPFALLLTLLFACNSTDGQPVAEQPKPLTGRNDVRGSAYRSPNWKIVYAGRNAEDAETLRASLEKVAKLTPRGKQFTLVNLTDANLDSLGRQPVFFVGNVLPVGLEASNLFKINGREWSRSITEKGDVFQLYYGKNPWSSPDSSAAFHLAYGTDATVLAKLVDDYYAERNGRNLIRNDFDYQLMQAGVIRRRGRFLNDTWEPDRSAEIHFNVADEPIYADSSLRVYAPDGYPEQLNISELVTKIARARAFTSRVLAAPPPDTLTVIAYPTVTRMGLRRESMQRAQFDREDGTLHWVFSAGPETDLDPEFHYALLKWQRSLAGEELPKELDFIDAGFSCFSSQRYADDYRQIAGALARHGQLLSRATLADRSERITVGRYFYDASAVGWMIAALEEAELALLLPKSPGGKSAVGAEGVFATLKSKAAKNPSDNWRKKLAKLNFAPPPAQTRPTTFRRGMTLAHEGYRVYNGYGGSTLQPSLDSLAELSVNSIAIVPYTSQRDKAKPAKMGITDYAGGENDEATIFSARQARQRGWSAMLKPQIWVGNGWPGNIDFTSDEDWDIFFDRYVQWMGHYAIMARLEDIESLCIGTELVRSTVDHPERWRKMIALFRDLYGGNLTYAANWGEEFENLAFWGDLDVIGLNSYYPLSREQEPTDAELLAGAEIWVTKAEAVAKRFNRPWWLTEVGFRSVRRAWLNPHAEAGDRPPSVDCQQRCFGAIFTALDETERFNGMYIWKWPSYLGYGEGGRREGTLFTPGGKPAAARVKQFYEGRK